MYSENNRRFAARRADDEFLRRMTGGDLIGNGFPVMNMNDTPTHSFLPARDVPPGRSCNGSTHKPELDCPTELHAPSLAMVYSPRQCWRKLLSPEDGLKAGSIFTELVFPLEVSLKKQSKEVNHRCCL